MLGINIFARSTPLLKPVVLSDDELAKLALESAKTRGERDREELLTLELITWYGPNKLIDFSLFFIKISIC